MNTFLPYADFVQSAKALDSKRLNKQVLECYQLLRVEPGMAWSHHPAFLMWEHHKGGLKRYALAVCDECIKRGIKCSLKEKIEEMRFVPCNYPEWLGDEEIHSSYRASLLFKDPAYYSRHQWTEQPMYGYKWPVTIKILRELAESQQNPGV